MPIALDGSQHFCSRKIKCEQCSTRRRADGGTEYFHAFLGASMVAPGHKQVLPLPPEFIAPQDGPEKQDCERNAANGGWPGTAPTSLTSGRHGGDPLRQLYPSDAGWRPAGRFDPLFCKAIETAGPLTPFQRLGGRVLIALDGTEHFCSRKIHCRAARHDKRSDGGTEYFHAFLGATIVAPGHQQVLPLPPEFIAPQDGAEKQDCERNAAKRWLARHGPAVAHLRPIFLGDDLFACQPIATAIQQAGGNFILTCKPASHQTIAEYLHGAELEEHRQTVCKRGKRTTTIYRWLAAVPLRATDDAILVNWFSIEIRNAKGKRTYYNSFVTDLPVTADTVAELAACGRARWKIENETFNVLKTNGYNLEHNFGHGKQTLASILVTLNLLAFAFHTAAWLAVLAWRAAIAARGATYRFFEHLRTVTAYVVFQDWHHLLQSIAAAAIRPP